MTARHAQKVRETRHEGHKIENVPKRGFFCGAVHQIKGEMHQNYGGNNQQGGSRGERDFTALRRYRKDQQQILWSITRRTPQQPQMGHALVPREATLVGNCVSEVPSRRPDACDAPL